MTSKHREKLKLWFFRDLSNGERIKLFRLFGMPADDLPNDGAQARAFQYVLAALAPSDAEPDTDEAAIDALRHKAFRSNSEADRQAYFDAVSKWFQHRHYRRMAHPDSSSEAVMEDGIELAARYVETRLNDYCAEHGFTDPDTGTVEYPGNGEEYVYELEDIIEGIRALKGGVKE